MFHLQAVEVPSKAELEEVAANELSLSDKILLANHPNVKVELERQLMDQLEEQRLEAVTLRETTELVNQLMQQEILKMGYKGLKVKLFIHPQEGVEVRVKEGLTVHYHFYGPLKYLIDKKFWRDLRKDIPKLHRLQRSSTLLVRQQYWEKRRDALNKWKRQPLKDETTDFKLLPEDEMQSYEEVRIVRVHKTTGISMSVTGDANDSISLDRECRVLLSQAVQEFMINRRIHETEVLDEYKELNRALNEQH